tara:strand:+ start:76 stop:825 length:750 start_codon:yes stop_codon:yes gene_type:complete
MKKNYLYNENCLDTMARMEDNFIDLTVTSPPYDNLRTYKGYSFDFESIAKELYRVTKEGGVVVWIVADATIKGSETGTSFRQALFFMECGFNLHDTMIWKKDKYVPLTHNRYEQQFEYMFIFSKKKPITVNHIMIDAIHAGKKPKRTFYQTSDSKKPTEEHTSKTVGKKKIKGNVWTFNPQSLGNGHPAIFPEQLANDHIISWSNENDIVYDPFMGSGTTSKMAKLNNRNYIGSEISDEYCNIANERLT